jgi:hypothetical protein
MPVIDFTRGSRFFGIEKFRYDPEKDLYHCPGGQVLRSNGLLHTERFARYKADAKVCSACALKPRCTDAKGGRTLRRSLDEHYRDKVRSYHQTEPYKRAMRKRKVWVEPMFAEAKEWHGLRRFRLRRLERVNIEALLTAAGQNIKRLLSARGRGPRRLAQAATLRLPESASHSQHRIARSSWALSPARKGFLNTLYDYPTPAQFL